MVRRHLNVSCIRFTARRAVQLQRKFLLVLLLIFDHLLLAVRTGFALELFLKFLRSNVNKTASKLSVVELKNNLTLEGVGYQTSGARATSRSKHSKRSSRANTHRRRLLERLHRLPKRLPELRKLTRPEQHRRDAADDDNLRQPETKKSRSHD